MLNLTGFMDGMQDGMQMGRQKRAEDMRREEFETEKRRQAEADAWGREQQGRQRHDWADEDIRNPIVRAREDRLGELNIRNAEQGVNRGDREAIRAPELERQHDELFSLDKAVKQLGMASTRQSMGNSARDQSWQERTRTREWNQQMILDETAQAKRAIGPALFHAQRSNDYEPLKRAWNETMGKHGQAVDDIRSEMGGVIITVNGKETAMSADGLADFVAKAIDPTAALDQMTKKKSGDYQIVAGSDGTQYRVPKEGGNAETIAGPDGAPLKAGRNASLTPADKKMLLGMRNNLGKLGAVEQQLNKVEQHFGKLQNTLSAGPLGGLVPSEDGQAFDRAVSTIAPLIRQMTRTPGEGSTSDLETKLQQLLLPDRGIRESTTQQQINDLRDLVTALKTAYSNDMLAYTDTDMMLDPTSVNRPLPSSEPAWLSGAGSSVAPAQSRQPAASQAAPARAPSAGPAETPPSPGAQRSPKDGRWYEPDPSRPGMWLLVD